MARTLTQLLTDRTTAAYGEPRFLLAIGDLYLTDYDRVPIQWDSKDWLPAPGIDLRRATLAPDGTAGGSIMLPLDALPEATDVLAGDLDDLPVSVALVYPTDGTLYPRQTLLLQEGYVESGYYLAVFAAAGHTILRAVVDEIVYRPPHWVELRLGSQSVQANMLPRVRITPPVFRHLPAPGEELVWADERLRIGA